MHPLLHLLSHSLPAASQCGCFKSSACFGTAQDLQCLQCPTTQWHGLKQTPTELDCPSATSTCTRPAAQCHSNRTGASPNATPRYLSQCDTTLPMQHPDASPNTSLSDAVARALHSGVVPLHLLVCSSISTLSRLTEFAAACCSVSERGTPESRVTFPHQVVEINGGAFKGVLTREGMLMALSLGAALRERYVDSNANNSAEVCSSKLLPNSWSAAERLVTTRSTRLERTVSTARRSVGPVCS